MDHPSDEIAHAAARLIAEEGLEYGPAKRRALAVLGLPSRTSLPDNDRVEAALREYLTIFCADTQPQELAVLRAIALKWMQRLAEFQPHVAGAVWHGTATRHNDVHLQLFCDDPKSPEWRLIDRGVRYQAGMVVGFKGGEVPVLSVDERCDALQAHIGVHLALYDLDDLKGALKPDSQGRTPRGSLAALGRLLEQEGGA